MTVHHSVNFIDICHYNTLKILKFDFAINSAKWEIRSIVVIVWSKMHILLHCYLSWYGRDFNLPRYKCKTKWKIKIVCSWWKQNTSVNPKMSRLAVIPFIMQEIFACNHETLISDLWRSSSYYLFIKSNTVYTHLISFAVLHKVYF